MNIAGEQRCQRYTTGGDTDELYIEPILFVKPGFLCNLERCAIPGQRTVRDDQKIKLFFLSVACRGAEKRDKNNNEREMFSSHGECEVANRTFS